MSFMKSKRTEEETNGHETDGNGAGNGHGDLTHEVVTSGATAEAEHAGVR